jgi:hypothetical protein
LNSLSAVLPVREPSVSEVRNELQAVLASRAFRQSRGLAKLLRYVCSKALENAEPITEYTIAVDVLGKSQDFKESKDASVRVEVHRLRKRLAEYYEQEGAQHSIRILIPTGQYTPQFLASTEGISEDHTAAPASPSVSDDTAIITPKRVWVAAGLLAVFALALVAILLQPADPLDNFWRPVFSSPNPILLCFGNVEGGQRAPAKTASVQDVTLLEYHGLASEMMLVPDAITVSRFAALLQSKGKRYRVASQSEASFADLQSGPAVLIGLANNEWTERLVGKLRFTVEHRAPRKLILRDSNNPSREDW